MIVLSLSALAVACLVTAVCVWLTDRHNQMIEDRINQAEMEYLWRRMSEHRVPEHRDYDREIAILRNLN